MLGIVGARYRGLRGRRSLVIIATVTSACLGVAGCGGSSGTTNADRGTDTRVLDPGKSAATKPIANLNVGFSQSATSMDPASGTYGYFSFGQLSLEQLLQIAPDGKLVPWLARSWSQPSPTEYVYNLRQGVKFWDGSELTSEDVVYSLLRNAGASLGKSGFYGSVDAITARDKYTVVVTLKKPDASWKTIPALFYSQIYEKAFTEAHKKTFGQPGTLVMGTGPWKLDGLDPTKQATLSANPTYWGGEPAIKHINVKFYGSDTSLALAMRSGDVDVAPIVAAPASFRSSSGARVTTRSTCATSLFSMPTQRKPWNDIHVRRAAAYAFDKNDLLKATGGADINTLDTLIAPELLESITSKQEVTDALKSLPSYQHSVDKAKQELAQSATPTGFSDTIVSTNDQATLRVTQAIVAQLKAIGINLKIKAITVTEQVPIIIGPADKRPVMWTPTGACSPDPSWDDLFIAGGALNEANWHPHDVDTLVAQGLLSQDPKERLKIYAQILQRVAEDLPYVPLFLEGTSYASNDYDWVGFGTFWQSTRWALNLKPR